MSTLGMIVGNIELNVESLLEASRKSEGYLESINDSFGGLITTIERADASILDMADVMLEMARVAERSDKTLDLISSQLENMTDEFQILAKSIDHATERTHQFNQGFTMMRGFFANLGADLARDALYALGDAIRAVGVGLIEQNALFETYTAQFRVLLGSTAEATARMEDLAEFARTTPFELPQVTEGARLLEVMAKGALSSTEALTMVGDAAAGAGYGMSEVALWVGRAYDNIQSGRPFGEATQRLQEMGIVTGGARKEMEELQKAGADADRVWEVLRQGLLRFEGQMDIMSGTMKGMRSNFIDTFNILLRQIGEESFDAIHDAMTELMEGFNDNGPQIRRWAEELGEDLGTVTENMIDVAQNINWAAIANGIAAIAEAAAKASGPVETLFGILGDIGRPIAQQLAFEEAVRQTIKTLEASGRAGEGQLLRDVFYSSDMETTYELISNMPHILEIFNGHIADSGEEMGVLSTNTLSAKDQLDILSGTIERTDVNAGLFADDLATLNVEMKNTHFLAQAASGALAGVGQALDTASSLLGAHVAMEEQLGPLYDKAAELAADYADKVSDINAKIAENEADYVRERAKVNQGYYEAQEQLNEGLYEAQQDYNQRLADLAETHTDRVAEIESRRNEAIDEVAEKRIELEAETLATLTEMEREHNEEVAELQKDLNDALADAEEARLELAAEYDRQLQEMEREHNEKMADLNRDLNELIEEYNYQRLLDAEDLRRDLEDLELKHSEAMQEIQRQIDQAVADSATNRAAIEQDLADEIEDIYEDLADRREDIAEDLAEKELDIAEKLAEDLDALAERYADRVDTINDRIGDLEKDIQKEQGKKTTTPEQAQRKAERLAELRERLQELRDQLKEEREEYEEHQAELKEKAEKAAQEARERAEKAAQEAQERADKAAAEAQERAEKELAEEQTRHERKLADLQRRLEAEQAEYERARQKRQEQFELEEIENRRKHEKAVEDMQRRIAREQEEYDRGRVEMDRKRDEELADIQEKHDEAVASLTDRMNKELAEYERHRVEVQAKADAELADINEKHDEALAALADRLADENRQYDRQRQDLAVKYAEQTADLRESYEERRAAIAAKLAEMEYDHGQMQWKLRLQLQETRNDYIIAMAEIAQSIYSPVVQATNLENSLNRIRHILSTPFVMNFEMNGLPEHMIPQSPSPFEQSLTRTIGLIEELSRTPLDLKISTQMERAVSSGNMYDIGAMVNINNPVLGGGQDINAISQQAGAAVQQMVQVELAKLVNRSISVKAGAFANLPGERV
jgi:hypothetical protein